MNNYRMIAPAFEKEKNIKALTYTMTVCILLFIIFFFVKWTLPHVTPPPVMEFVEVNLGNSDQGLGDVPPKMPGEPAAAKDEQYSPPAAAQPAPQQEQNITGDENETDDAPAVNKTVKPVTRPNNIPAPVVTRPKPNTQPIVNPTPAPPKPKAVYKGGTASGAGGNNADSYNGVHNQGIAGGNGDQGSPNGNPNSNNYQGNGGSGIRMSNNLKNRGISFLPKLSVTDDWRGTVAVNIILDASGKVVSASKNPKGTTPTLSTAAINFAIQQAYSIKYKSSDDNEESGTVFIQYKY